MSSFPDAPVHDAATELGDAPAHSEVGSTDGPWVVILYNCDCHSFEDVIVQLQVATSCSLEHAAAIAVEAHTRGRAVAMIGDRAECDRAAGLLRAIRLQVETDRF